jgi:hypothetical protein
MAGHAKDTLRGSCVAQVLDLAFANPAPEARRTKGLISSQNSKIFNFIATCAATVGTVVAYQRTITEQKKVCVQVEECSTCVASKAVDMPSITSYSY